MTLTVLENVQSQQSVTRAGKKGGVAHRYLRSMPYFLVKWL